jgi:hypothetical protein
MTNYNITLGSSNTVKGKRAVEHFLLNVPSKFSFDEMKDNYRKNVAMFGIDPVRIGDADGGQPFVSDEDMEILEHYGVVHSIWSKGFVNYISENDFVAILMFLFGHGLDDFTYGDVTRVKELDNNNLNLVGNGGVETELGVDFY